MRRKSSAQILADLESKDDGLVTRSVGAWTLEKLAILNLYFRAFTSACRGAGGGYYVDGFAGPGLCQVRDAVAPPFLVWGSPLLAAKTVPQFARCVFIELSVPSATALQQRAAAYADRCTVVQGDANRDLPGIIKQLVPSRAPCFCLLDPEGMELSWQTVPAVASTPNRTRKPELLILFPSGWLTRTLPVRREKPPNERALDALFPNRNWRDVYRARLAGSIAPPDARMRYLEIYRTGLLDLGYRAFARPVRAASRPGGLRRHQYHLVFATQHKAGEAIMQDVFQRPYVLDFPVTATPPLFD